ncbi:MAG: YCF48-related protein, partial [Planctomycetaceae bacterium]
MIRLPRLVFAFVLLLSGSTLDRACANEQVSPELDDATLNAVFFRSLDDGFAVGVHGAIWQTSDGGQSWNLKTSPVAGLHEAITFVNGKTGWIVGSSTMPTNLLPLGYVLRTEDGGETWKLLAGRPTVNPASPNAGHRYLPRLRSVRFFTTKLGFAVGDANRFYPSGVLRTDDGGETWEPVEGDAGSWRCGWFMNPETGFVAGRLNTRGTVKGERIEKVAGQLADLRSWRSIQVSSTNPSWMVGDGARVLYSDDGGVNWRQPIKSLPRGIRNFSNFNSVAARGANVWIAGSPGSVIWHSANGGQSWEAQQTGQTVPLRGIFFRSETHGWAVGDLGLVLRTSDAGATWSAVKGADRRVAMVAMSSREGRIPFHVLAKESGEHGYRSSVFIPVRRDLDREFDKQDVFREAVAGSLGNTSDVAWAFPIAKAGIDQVDAQLVKDWQMRTEGKLGQTLLSALVSKLRTLRPDVVLLDHEEANDAATRITNTALLRAVEMAADPAHFVDQIRISGLHPWQVKRVFKRIPDQGRGAVEVAAHEVLQRRSKTVGSVANQSFRLVAGASSSGNLVPDRSAFRRVYPPLTEGEPRAGFFRGLSLPPGSAARRPSLRMTEDHAEFLTELAKRQRNLAGYMDRFLKADRNASQVLAQLNELTSDLPDEMAAKQLQQIADRYAEVHKWNLVEAVLRDLVTRYPATLEATAGREWLMSWWAGAEPAWQRLRYASVGGEIVQTGHIAGALTPPKRDLLPKSFSQNEVGEAQAGTRTSMMDNYRASALKMAGELKQFDPLKFESSAQQMRVAALMRLRDKRAGALAIYNSGHHEDAWKRVVANEAWLDQQATQPPKSVVVMRRAARPPELDGVLSDACWQGAKEIWLRGDDIDSEQGSFAAMAYADEYLYLAAATRRHPSTSSVQSHKG